MDKEFDKWNKLKKETHSNDEYLPLYHERQVRWCRLGVNVGFEQDGTGKDFLLFSPLRGPARRHL